MAHDRIRSPQADLALPEPRQEPTSAEGGARSSGAPARTYPRGINVVGYFRAELGVGEAARRLVAGLRSADIPYATITCTTRTVSRQEHPFDDGMSQSTLYDVNLVCVNADQLPVVARDLGPALFRGRYCVGVWWWEVSVFPAYLQASFDLVDEVWVGSEYVREAIAHSTAKPVRVIPIPVDSTTKELLDRATLGLPRGFMFLFVFDFLSIFQRKNPLALVAAFRRAFEPGSGAILVIKSVNGELYPQQRELLQRAASAHPDITTIDDYLPAHEKNSYMAACDCYVSLHRSEGFGLTMAEAMSYGKPVIGTGYSGNLEFMDEENSFLVPYTAARVPSGCDPYPVGAEWAEPDVEAAARIMRWVFEHPEIASERGERGRRDILSKHSPARTGDFVAQRMDEMTIGGGPRARAVPAVGPAPSRPHRSWPPGGVRPFVRRLLRRK